MENKKLEKKEKISIWKIILLLWLISIIWFWIFGSLCGGFFLTLMPESISISLPSLLWGIFLAIAWILINKKFNSFFKWYYTIAIIVSIITLISIFLFSLFFM